jgi:hypothetical protein
MEREPLPDGSLRLRADDVCFTYTRLGPGALRVHIRGYDRGLLGAAVFEPIHAELKLYSPLALLVDARDTEGATSAVSTAWTAWFQEQRPRLHEVHILVASKLVGVTVNVAKHFSRTGELIRIHSDPAAFEAAAVRLVPGLRRLPAVP